MGIACVPQPKLAHCARVLIVVNTGPEALTGSTRMKAGTAQKLVLNTFSTALMVRLGKVYGNRMVDVQATNAKLRERAIRLVSEIAGAEAERARTALETADWQVKTAVVSLARAERLGLKLRSRLLLSAEVIRDFEWAQ